MARTCRESCALMPMIARSERDQGNDVGSEELAVGLAVRSPSAASPAGASKPEEHRSIRCVVLTGHTVGPA